MTSGRWLAIAIIVTTAVFGAFLWYFQTRAYYEPVALSALPVTLADGTVIPLDVTDFDGIDADSSPLRFRACFTVDEAALALLAEAAPPTDPAPLIAPAWFECYNAVRIGEAIEAGEAIAVLSRHEIARGVDRIIAAYPDGRGFAWHQLNGTLE
ncbi:DUF6446 family protein [Rhodophyticola porphyridii]|uniref:Histidine kinase n=1 Tax=Rhodophyticola porphyridii TaxID=1852017 RepID=A0A3L9YA86_9RHOB|nr:DUF6446 family protein [Rhodophyticola porphyridii]RMA43143.1 histidine kinase [Rhodophyticola porphyridii]